jgi:hypothetical protein
MEQQNKEEKKQCYSLAIIANAATIKNATPVQNKSPAVNKYTIIAMSTAGIRTKNSLMNAIMIKPMMTKTMSAIKSKVKLPST